MERRARHLPGRPVSQSAGHRAHRRGCRLLTAFTVVALLAVAALMASGGSLRPVAHHEHASTLAPLERVMRTRGHIADAGHVPVPITLPTVALAIGLVFAGLVVIAGAGRPNDLRLAAVSSRSPPTRRR